MSLKTTGLAASLVIVSALFAGCGGGKATDTAKVMNLFRNNNGAAGRVGAREMISRAKSQAWLERFRVEAGQMQTAATADDYGLPDGCTVTGSSDSFTSGGAFGFSCTSTEEFKGTCDGEEYTIAKGMTMSTSMKMTTMTESALEMTFDFDMNAVVTGGDFKETKLECDIGMTFKADAGDSEPEVTCASGSKCNIGGEEMSCEDFADEAADEDNDCKA